MKPDDDALDSLLQHASDSAAHFFKKNGSLTPVWIVENERGERAVLPTPWRDSAEKRAMILALRKTFRAAGVVRYVSILEAWLLRVSKDQLDDSRPVDLSKLPLPSESPDREEVVILTGEDISGTQKALVRPIIRPERGRPRLGPSRADSTLSDMVGPMAGMLGADAVPNKH